MTDRRSRVTLIGIIIAVLLLATAGANAITRYNKPPTIKILADAKGEVIPYVTRISKWNGKIPESLSVSEGLFTKVLHGQVPDCDYSTPITFDFGTRKPDKATLVVDYYTNPTMSFWEPPEAVELVDLSFSHPLNPSKRVTRFYVLTAHWGDNVVEYAFAVNVIG